MGLPFGILRGTPLVLIFLVAWSRSQDAESATMAGNILRLKKDLGLIGDQNIVDRHSRPVKNADKQLQVSVYLMVLHLHSLDELTGTLRLDGWAQMLWQDAYMEWNPSDYGGTYSLLVPNDVIWQPDLVLYNRVQGFDVNNFGDSMLQVANNGMVSWMPSFTLRTACPIDHVNFPFDEHQCKFELGSWAYTSSLLNLSILYTEHPEARLINEYYVENPLWELSNFQSSIRNLTLDCCPEIAFPLIESKMQVRRRSPFHKYLFVVPSLVTMFLTLALFWLPANSGEKIILGGIVVLTQIVLLACLNFTIPPGGKHIPKIVLFCGNSLIMSCLAVIISVVVIRLSRGDPYMPIPSTIRKLLSSPVRRLLLLPSNPRQLTEPSLMCDQSVEVDIEDDDVEGDAGTSTTTTKRCAMTMEPSKTRVATSYDWLSLATAIDQLCFYFYIVIYAILLANSFI